ncbi:MAG: RNA polymerase subunit sigma [Verrucomicrobiae bacterium]|nr:RNA polymerase subunit sigma [Verrucomicrobiae bacterium]
MHGAEHQIDAGGAEDLLPLVYEDLRRLAAVKLDGEVPGQTLQPTALVHEVWLRLSSENHPWANRRQFFAAAAEAMRRILIERARKRRRVKHGGKLRRTTVDDLDLAATTNDDETILRVSDAVERLAVQDPVGAELIRLRFFAGLSNVEAAELMGMSERSGKRAWAYARAWLYEELRREA